MNLRRITGWLGVASVVVLLIPVFVLGAPPKSDATPSDYLAYVHAHRGGFFAFATTTVLGLSLALMFLVGLRGILASPKPGVDLWARAGLTLAVVVFAMGSVAMSVYAALAYRANEQTQPVKVLWDVAVAMTFVSNVVTVPMAVAFAVAMFSTAAIGRWAAWLTLVVAVAHAVSCLAWSQRGAFSPNGIGAQIGAGWFVLWIVALSIAFIRDADEFDPVPVAAV